MLQICSLKDKTHDKSTTENLAAKDGAISGKWNCIALSLKITTILKQFHFSTFSVGALSNIVMCEIS